MRPLKFFLGPVFLFFLILTGVNPWAWSSDVVIIKGFEKVEISDDSILLGKICAVNGDDGSLVARIKGIVLGKAPLPGNTRRIGEDYIRLRLKHAQLDLNRIRLSVPRSIEVGRESVVISREELKRAVSDFIYANIPWDKDRVKINKIQIGGDVILPKGNISYRIESPRNSDFKGRVPLPIHFKVNGLFQKRILATADITVLTDVVVAKRPLRRHGRITEDDVELREKDLARLPSNIITDLDEVLGKRAKRTISADTVLRPHLVEYPPMVKRGDVVVVIAESAGLMVTALGVVKERQGRRGERIKVENLDSKKSIYARVVDSKTVKVDF